MDVLVLVAGLLLVDADLEELEVILDKYGREMEDVLRFAFQS